MLTQEISNFHKNLLIGFLLLLTFLFLKEFAAIGVQESDGAEIAFQAVNAGVLHPPGFPLYSLISIPLVRLFPINPYETLAIFSAFCQCLATFILYSTCHRLTNSLLFSIAIALSWLLFPATLRSATDTEVFALNNLLFSITCFFSLNAITEKRSGALLLSTFCFGLAVSNHHMSVLALPFILIALWQNYSVKNFLYSLFTGLLGLTPYLYLIYRIEHPADYTFFPLNNISDLINYFLRSGYGTFSLTQADIDHISYLPHFLGMAFRHNPLAIIGVALLIFSVRKAQNLAALLSLLLHIWFGYNLIFSPNVEIQGELLMRFYPQIYLSLLFCLILTKDNFKHPALLALLIAGISIPALSKANNSLHLADASHDLTIDIEIRQILKELPVNAVFLSPLDRLSLGIPLYQKVYSLNQTAKVIIPGMLKSSEYRKSLKKLNLPYFNNLEENIKALLENNYRVFSYTSTKLPEGYYWEAKGLIWEAKSINLKSNEETIANIMKYCANFPLEIFRANPHRLNSAAIINNTFLLSVKYILVTPDFQLSVAQRQALTMLISGQEQAGIQLCRQSFND
jgi:hypothetical protein